MKKCSRCNKRKNLSEFYRDRQTPSGRRSECKSCSTSTKSKTCTRCNAHKPVSEFSRYSDTGSLLPWCKSCVKPTKSSLPANTKQCKRCAAIKPLKDFGKHAKTRDGYQTICRLCWSAISSKSNATKDKKVCSKCKVAKPHDLFSRNVNSGDGLQYYCKDCIAEYRPKAAKSKECTKCKEVKTRDMFHKNANAKDGLQDWCKECIRSYDLARREKMRTVNAKERKAAKPVVQPKPQNTDLPLLNGNDRIHASVEAREKEIYAALDSIVQKYIAEKFKRVIDTLAEIGETFLDGGKVLLAEMIKQERR